MKKILTCLAIFVSTFTIYSGVQALTMGIEPPAEFIDSLKTCKKGHFEQKGTTIERYDIKGKKPNGRCEVYMDTYTDFTNKETYEMAVNFIEGFGKAFAGDKFDKSKIPSQDELIKMSKESINTTTCKFSQSDIDALVTAYNKHDNKNPAPTMKDSSLSFSFDTSKMSSFDKLLLNYQMGGPCTQSKSGKDDDQWIKEVYSCEYSDTTCYVHHSYSKGKDGGASAYTMSCSGEISKYGNLDSKMRDVIIGHVKAGKCEKL